MNKFASFVKYQRKKKDLTQEMLASKAGVGIRFIRELEQGKGTIQLNKLEIILNMFGFQLTAGKQLLDPYDLYWKYINKPVKITLTNRLIKQGMITNEIIDKKENKIIAWQFSENKNAFSKKSKVTSPEIIVHADIKSIEYQ